jgi:hypothetical protein
MTYSNPVAYEQFMGRWSGRLAPSFLRFPFLSAADKLAITTGPVAWVASLDLNLVGFAIAFPLAHPAVASVCLGARSAKQVQRNVALYSEPIPTDLWSELKATGLLRADAPVPASPHDQFQARPEA